MTGDRLPRIEPDADRTMHPQQRPDDSDAPPAAARPLATIHMFWHGSPLSRLERLCIASFLAHGHPLDLYVYDEPGEVPPGTRLRDAGEILSRELLFIHRRTSSFGVFSDWFRYRVLLEHGGIWADADVVCLRPLDYRDPVIFAWQDPRWLNGAVLGLPPQHELAAWLAAACESPNQPLPSDDFKTRLHKWRRKLIYGDRRDKIRWGEYGPKGLTHAARHLGYLDRALPAWHFYPVADPDWRVLFEPHHGEPLWRADSRTVHLWHNRVKQSPELDKFRPFHPDSPFEQLCRRYLGKGDGGN